MRHPSALEHGAHCRRWIHCHRRGLGQQGGSQAPIRIHQDEGKQPNGRQAHLPPHRFVRGPRRFGDLTSPPSSSFAGLGKGPQFLPPHPATRAADLTANRQIQVKWYDGMWYDAQILKPRRNGAFSVLFTTGEESKVPLFPLGAGEVLLFKVAPEFVAEMELLHESGSKPDVRAAVRSFTPSALTASSGGG